jgi:pyridoxine 4-dehydrogenase
MEQNIQLIGYSALGLGLLADKYTLDNLPKGPRSLLFKEFLPSIEPLLKVMREIALKRNKKVSQVALNWSLQKGFLVLVGIRSIEQAKENLNASGWKLSDAEITELDKITNSIPKQIIQNSFQSD